MPAGARADGPSAGAQRDALRQEGSRHRYRYAPPNTPPGFWKVGFPGDSLVRPSCCRTRARGLQEGVLQVWCAAACNAWRLEGTLPCEGLVRRSCCKAHAERAGCVLLAARTARHLGKVSSAIQ